MNKKQLKLMLEDTNKDILLLSNQITFQILNCENFDLIRHAGHFKFLILKRDRYYKKLQSK